MNSCVLAGSIQTTPQVSSGDSEAKPLIFTFVPTVRRLPTHSKLADTSKFLVKIPEEPSDKNPETVNRSESNEYLTLNAGSQRERNQGTLIYPSEGSEKISQARGIKANELQGMQQSDLFKAEYVFIVDSEGEDEDTSGKCEQGPPGGMGTTASRPKSLAISSSLVSDVVRPKTRGTDLQAPSYPEMSHGIAPQQKHGQLTSSPTTSEQLACKPSAFSFVSPTNQKTPPDPVNLDGASVLEEFHTRRLDVSGALVEETTTYFQTSAHSSPFFASKGTSSTSQFPHSTQLSVSNLSSPRAADQKPGLASEVLKKTTAFTSHVLSPRESPRTTSPSPSSSASVKSNSGSYIPALDEPAKTESVFKDNTLYPPLELRQQTEELCATIDKVLQDSLSMANLSSPSSTVSDNQLTKPGVIRPVPAKSKILLKKEEEVYEPNPFSKYLEDNSDFFSEQDVTVPPKPVSLHPLYQPRLYPPAQSLLPPQTLSHADCLTPGPFSHLSSFSLSDEQGNSHTLFSGNTYNKNPRETIVEGDVESTRKNTEAGVAADRIAIQSKGQYTANLSPQNLISCCAKNRHGCNSGSIDRAWWFLRKRGLVSHACYPLFKDQNATNYGCAMASRSDGRGKRHATKPCPNNIEKSNRIYQCSPPYRVSSNETEIMKEIMQNGPVQVHFLYSDLKNSSAPYMLSVNYGIQSGHYLTNLLLDATLASLFN
ncbi:hypothetical protein GH733_000469 [Mirounga leonina]|nr:hypothetical protein GH733_000469 [Mirounga leonina]